MSKKLKSMLHDTYVSEFAEGDGILVIDLIPLPVDDVNRLRRSLEAERLRMRVVRNRIARKALDAHGRASLGGVFSGQSAVIYGEGEEAPIRASKVLAEWGRKNPGIPVRGGLLEGAFLPAKKAEALALLPDRPTALAQLAGMFVAPVRGFATALGGVTAGFVRALHQLSEQRKDAEEAST